MRRFLILALLIATLCTFISAQALDREATSIKIRPKADVNPVETQHTFIATVYDQNGNPLPNQKVEWILSRTKDGVGDIVEHDDMGAIVGTDKMVKKISNHYSITYTNERPVVLTKGTANPNDDIKLGVGETWLTITSPVEGITHVIAFCPAIKNADKHKVFAKKHWIDAKIDWPVDAVNKVGTPHTFKFKLMKASAVVPMPDYSVKWELLPEGPSAYLGDNKKVVDTVTDAMGEAKVVLSQSELKVGVNVVKIQLYNPTGDLLAERKVRKRWIADDIKITKNGPAEGIKTEKVVYNISITNQGEADANEVKIVDVLPQGLSYLDSDIKPEKVEGKEVTWNVGNLDPGASFKVTLITRADQVGEWMNTATVYTKRGQGPSDNAVTKIGEPDLFVVKEGPAKVRLGTPATYTLRIKNNGNAVARDVSIRDEVPAGMKYRNRDQGFALRYPVGTLQPGEEKQFVYTLDTIKTGTFINTAKAYITEQVVHKTSFTTEVIAPSLKIKKTGPRVAHLYKSVTFKIKVWNEGDADAYNVQVIDTFPKNFDFVSSNPQGSKRTGENQQTMVVWDIGNLKPQEEREIEIILRGKAEGTLIINQAKAISEGMVVIDEAPIKIQGVPAMHISTYDTEDPCEIGRNTIYVIQVTNEGTSPCSEINMTDIVPEEMEFVSATGPATYKVTGNTVVFEPVPILNPGDTLNYKIVCRAVRKGSAKNTAKLRYREFSLEIIDEEGTSIYD